MPTYEYACDACKHEFEEFQSITADPLTQCPKCGRKKLRRLLGAGGGIIFKGSGFYQTDYRSESYKSAADSEKKAVTGDKPAKGGDSASAQTDSKTGSSGASKSESTAAAKSSGDSNSTSSTTSKRKK